MSDTKQRYEELTQKINDLRGQQKELAQLLFTEATEALFEQHPSLLRFGWKQYTPYFNDGSPCEFSVKSSYIHLQFTDSEGNDEDFTGYDYEYMVRAANNRINKIPNWKGELTPPTPYDSTIVAVGELLETFKEEDLLALFGDHSFIRVERTGEIITEEYEHE